MDEQLVKATPKPTALQHKKGQEPRQELLDCVLLVIKASIHHFLFLRKIYPQRWFKSERIFLTYTKACRHPTVREYVSEAIASIKMPGCAPHELLCIHPTVLLDKAATSVPWEDVDGALRGFLLQMHSLQYAMPDAIEGATFHVSFQAQTPSDVPKPTWALYEDPRQLAIDAAEASILEAPEPSPPAAYSGCHNASPPSEDLHAENLAEENVPDESAEFAGSNQYSPLFSQSQSQDRHASAHLATSRAATTPQPPGENLTAKQANYSLPPCSLGQGSQQQHACIPEHLAPTHACVPHFPRPYHPDSHPNSHNSQPRNSQLPRSCAAADPLSSTPNGSAQHVCMQPPSQQHGPSTHRAHEGAGMPTCTAQQPQQHHDNSHPEDTSQHSQLSGKALVGRRSHSTQHNSSQNSGMLELLRAFDDSGGAEQDVCANDGTDDENVPEASVSHPDPANLADAAAPGSMHAAAHTTIALAERDSIAGRQAATIANDSIVNCSSQQGGLNGTQEGFYSAGSAGAIERRSGGVGVKRRKHLEGSDAAGGAVGFVSRKRRQSLGEGTEGLNGSAEQCEDDRGVIVLDDSPVAQQPAAVATGAPMATVAREDPDGEHVCTKPHSTPQLPSSPRSPDNIHQGRRSSDEGAAGDQTDAGTPGFLGADGDDSPDFFGALMGSYDGFAQRPARPPLHSQDGSEDAPASTGGSDGVMGSGDTHAKHASQGGSAGDAVEQGEDEEPPHVVHLAPPEAAANMVLRPLIDTQIPGVLWLRANVLYLQERQRVT